MNIRMIFKQSVIGLLAHKGRSALTILGIVIGITAIILVMSMGQSAQKLILDQVQGLGSKTIAIIPGREPSGPSDVASLFLDSLKEKDLESLKNKSNVPFAEEVMPVVIGAVKLSYEQESTQSTVLGGGDAENSNIMARIFDVFPDRGSFFTPEDVASQGSVMVIGDKVREDLFGGTIDPLGKKVKVNGKNFRIIGVLPKKGQVSFFNFDDMVLVPYTTAQQYVLGKKNFDRIIVVASSEEVIDQTVRDIEVTLRNNHEITDPDKDDFFVQTQANILETVGLITTILTLLLTSIAAVSLVVGGVGIMNIMLVSVTERTREIGLRKAVGATYRDILRQFLFEAVLLTVAGGIIGIILGASLSLLASIVITQFYDITFNFVFPYVAAVIGVLVSGGVGLLFGIYPARQAALKSPIEALRYE